MSNGIPDIPRVISVNVSTGGIPKRPVPEARVLAACIEGDGRDHAKHDKADRAISLLDDEMLAVLRAEGYDVTPGALGENLTVRGLGLQEMAPGMRLRFTGGVEIELTEERKPCFVLDSIHPSLKEAVVGRCGFLARVVTEGTLAAGAEITVLPSRRWPHTGVILAGGNSRRMGAPKEGVCLPDGRAMIEPVFAVLQAMCRQVVVVGTCSGYTLPASVGRIDDLHPGDGPLAGIEALLTSGGDDQYLIAACDQPLLTPALLHRLLQAQTPGQGACFTTDDRSVIPFPAVYLGEWLPMVRAALNQGDLSVCRLLEQLPMTRVPIELAKARRLVSLNTPAELAKLGDNIVPFAAPVTGTAPFSTAESRE